MRARFLRAAAPGHMAVFSTTASALRSCKVERQAAKQVSQERARRRPAPTRLTPSSGKHTWPNAAGYRQHTICSKPTAQLTSPSASSCLRRSIIFSPRLLYSFAICCAKAAAGRSRGNGG